MTLTNQQIEEAIGALGTFNPPIHLRGKIRLSQNLRALEQARKVKEHHRIRLAHSVIKDKDRKVAEQGLPMTVEEAAQLQAEYAELMAMEVEVDIRPLEVWDSSAEGTAPDDEEIAIDLAKLPDLTFRDLAPLWGVLVEVDEPHPFASIIEEDQKRKQA